jgi:integrase
LSRIIVIGQSSTEPVRLTITAIEDRYDPTPPRWAMRTKLLTRVGLPHQDTGNPAPISQQQRLSLIRRLIVSDTIALPTRVAALLLLLYAQPLTRILRLTTSDVLRTGDRVAIRIGDPPSPVPEPVAALLIAHVDNRLNLTTATNRNADWLFPGRRGGQPMTTDGIERWFRAHQIPALTGRTAALRQLVLQMPAPIVARMLGYTHEQTARLAAEAGSPWSHYGPEDQRQGLHDS